MQCQRLKEAAEREARALYSTAKVRMAAVERSAIQTRKDLNTLEDLDNIARMKLDFEVKTREVIHYMHLSVSDVGRNHDLHTPHAQLSFLPFIPVAGRDVSRGDYGNA